MLFEHTEDRRILENSLTRYLTDQYSFEHRTEVAYTHPYHDNNKWQDLVELGILYALIKEEHGGIGGNGFDISVVFEAIGKSICPEPVLPALLAAQILSETGQDLDQLISGECKYAVGIGEYHAPYVIDHIETTSQTSGNSYLLNGRKSVVYGGNVADKLIIAAKLDTKLALFEITANDAEIKGYNMIDGGGAADVILNNTPATLLVSDAGATIKKALDFGTLALCSEAVGLMDVSFELMLDYLRTRKQFGTAIGKFQALQHRCVDMAAEIEQCRSITILAASKMDEENRSHYISMAKNLIGRTVKLIAEESIQMQGGIGMTWEYQSSHYAKRLVMIDHQLGDTDFHLHQVMSNLISKNG